MKPLSDNIPFYCINETLRKWNLGGSIDCDGNFADCKHAVIIGRQAYCGYCPPRCSRHQVIKGQAGCLWCKHYTKDLTSSKCAECLGSETRINFEDCGDKRTL